MRTETGAVRRGRRAGARSAPAARRAAWCCAALAGIVWRWRAGCCCCCSRSPASSAPLAAAWLGHDPNAVDLLARFAPPSCRASARHRRARPRPAAAPAVRRPDLAVRRPGGRARGGRARHADRPGRRVPRRAHRRAADATDRCGHRAAAAAALDRARRGRSDQARPARGARAVGGGEPLSHPADRGPGRLDHGRPAGPRHDASVRTRDFIRAAVAQGAGPLRIMLATSCRTWSRR